MDKDSIIEKIYTDPAGLGSTTQTWKDVNKSVPSKTKDDVNNWLAKNTHRRNNLSGYNSYVPPGPNYEYQIDLFQMSDLKGEDQDKFKHARLCIDTFTKILSVPIKSKSEGDFFSWFDGVLQASRI